MFFKNLLLTNYRNIQMADLSLHPKVNIFIGNNGQGKTNLLESVYLLSTGKSFRSSDISVLCNNEEAFFTVNGMFSTDYAEQEVRFGFIGGRKKILLNGKATTSAKIQTQLKTILFSPESLSIIKNSDKERRDFVDEILQSVNATTIPLVNEFKKLQRQRNKFLKDLSKQEIAWDSNSQTYLQTLTESFLKCSAKLTVERLNLLKNIIPYVEKSMNYVNNSSDLNATIEYLISGEVIGTFDVEKIYDVMLQRAVELRQAEVAVGYSLVGAHKHDIRFLLKKNDSRYYASQGQQRLIILAFKMAHIELHYETLKFYPTLLLDDVLSELDDSKKVKLIEYLKKIEAQIFITTAEKSVLKSLAYTDMKVFYVNNGEFNTSDMNTNISNEGSLNV